jgi:hypothetical protein
MEGSEGSRKYHVIEKSWKDWAIMMNAVGSASAQAHLCSTREDDYAVRNNETQRCSRREMYSDPPAQQAAWAKPDIAQSLQQDKNKIESSQGLI